MGFYNPPSDPLKLRKVVFLENYVIVQVGCCASVLAFEVDLNVLGVIASESVALHFLLPATAINDLFLNALNWVQE